MTIIQFPGRAPLSVDPPPEPGLSQDQGEAIERMPTAGNPATFLPTIDGEKLTLDQAKAVALVLSGQAFVMVSIVPTQRGADFFTAMHGDQADLRNARQHLGDVIDRLYTRKGLL